MKIFNKYCCVRQQDLKDCGAACLATVLEKYNLKVPIAKIREYAKTDNDGTTIHGLIEASRKMNLKCKALKTDDYEDIKGSYPKPAIAHVIINESFHHFVVIHKVTNKKVIVADPLVGIIKYTHEEFSKLWTKVIILFSPPNNIEEHNKSNGMTIKFYEMIKSQKKLFFYVIIASLITTLLGIVGSFYFKFIIDDILPSGLKSNLFNISSAIVILTIFKIIFEYFRSMLLVYLSQNIDISLLLGYFDHVIDLPMKFFSTRKTGEIISRFSDATNIREALSNVIVTTVIDLFMVIVGAIVLLSQNKKLFLMSFIPITIYFFIALIFKKPLENYNNKVMEDSSQLYSYLYQSVQGIETIKSFNCEDTIKSETRNKFMNFVSSFISYSKTTNILVALKSIIQSVFPILIIWVGTILLLNGEISLGVLMSFNMLLAYFLGPVERILNLQPTIQTGIVAAKRLGEILEIEKEKLKDEDDKIKPEFINGDIICKNVNFSYSYNKIALSNINLNINSGERIAFVGESGSGKTTLAKLLMGFYTIDSGEIFIDSYDIRDINKNSLRDNITYMNQNPFFFSGTIKENLLFANKNATYNQIIEACKYANIHEFINTLPNRYNSYLEENALNLSSGQRQRLAIARAILTNPKIIIMDESTSNLDASTEKEIEKTIKNLTKNITTIIIAHRLNTIIDCNKIFVFKTGKIIESGTHDELLKSNGAYFKLWNDQIQR